MFKFLQKPKNNQLFKNLSRLFSKKQQNYYNILGVPKTATQADVKKAYAKLAREFHPDKNSAVDAKHKFSEINDAYATLNDEKKRNIYNQTGMTGDEQKQYTQQGSQPEEGVDFSDFFNYQSQGANPYENIFKDFEDVFGGESFKASKRPQKGADIQVSIEIDFMEAVQGITKEVSYRAKDVCGTCKGSKCKPGTSPTKCSTCTGKGTINYRQGPMQIQMGCSTCKTSGTVIRNPCQNCKGSGVSQTVLRERVDIPKGINSNQVLRVSTKGNAGENGGSKGDLLIKVIVKPDMYFNREGYDVHSQVPISICQAVLGCSFEVRTLNGKKTIHIQPGSLHGAKIKLVGEGLTKLAPNHLQKGDQFVTLSIAVPKSLTHDQRIIFEALRLVDQNNGVAPTYNPSDDGDENEKDKKGRELFQSFENLFTKKAF